MSHKTWSILFFIIGLATILKGVDTIRVVSLIHANSALLFEIGKLLVLLMVQFFNWRSWLTYRREPSNKELGSLCFKDMLACWILSFASDCALTRCLTKIH